MLRAKELKLVRQYERIHYSIDPSFLVIAFVVGLALPIHLLLFLLGNPVDVAAEARIHMRS